jgi:hypothetical protein
MFVGGWNSVGRGWLTGSMKIPADPKIKESGAFYAIT